jgi:hypothetical protein
MADVTQMPVKILVHFADFSVGIGVSASFFMVELFGGNRVLGKNQCLVREQGKPLVAHVISNARKHAICPD